MVISNTSHVIAQGLLEVADRFVIITFVGPGDPEVVPVSGHARVGRRKRNKGADVMSRAIQR